MTAIAPIAASVPTGHELVTALVTGVLLGGLFAVTALGLSLVFGVMRLINLVHGELLVLGAYLAPGARPARGDGPAALDRDRRAGAVPDRRAGLAACCSSPLQSKGPEPALLTTFGLSIIAQNLFILIFSGDTQSLKASYAIVVAVRARDRHPGDVRDLASGSASCSDRRPSLLSAHRARPRDPGELGGPRPRRRRSASTSARAHLRLRPRRRLRGGRRRARRADVLSSPRRAA